MVYQPLVKELRRLIKEFNGTKRFLFRARKALKMEGIALLNQHIKNIMWLGEVSEERRNKVLADSQTWSHYEQIAREALLKLETLGKSK